MDGVDNHYNAQFSYVHYRAGLLHTVVISN